MPTISQALPQKAITIGESMNEVVTDGGQPTTIETVDAKTVYIYPHATITFSDDKVMEIRSTAAANQPALGTEAPRKRATQNGADVGGAVGWHGSGLGKLGFVGRRIRLPSGLPSNVDVYSRGHWLALDRAGTLFTLMAEGDWRSVTPQWTGRATGLRNVSTSQDGTAVSPNSSDSTSVTVLFELVNDAGQVWTSADGRTWLPK